jgi:chloramphenicol O-acetyltransferase type B
MNKIYRSLLLPFGLLKSLYLISKDGARDICNKQRFKNSIIDSGCCINEETNIEKNTHILEGCLILDSVIKQYSYVGKNSIIQNATIGSFCSIANDVFIGLGRHPLDNFSTSTLFYQTNNTFNIKLADNDTDFSEYEEIEICNDVWVGAKVIIMDGVKIYDGAVIAAGAVVTKDVPAYAIVAGVPAKVIKYRFSAEKIESLLKSEWWKRDIEWIKKNVKKF